MTNPSVSVVIPAFNAAQFLPRTLESVLAQTYPVAEIIVVDDGSTDGSADIARGFPNTFVLEQRNTGVSAARNRGIAHAGGAYVALLDADDIWYPEKLEKQLEVFRCFPKIGMLIADELLFIGEETNVIQASVLRSTTFASLLGDSPFVPSQPVTMLLKETFVSTSSVIAPKALFEQAGPFDTNLSICEDRDVWLRLAIAAPIGILPEVLVKKRQAHGGNLSNIDDVTWARGIEYVLKKNLRDITTRLTTEGTGLSDSVGVLYSRIGNVYWYSNDFEGALRCFRSALRFGRINDLPKLFACTMGSSFVRHCRKLKNGIGQ